MRERLIELLKKAEINEPPIHRKIIDFAEVNVLADHLLANGVIVPPCKVGDTVYEIVHGEILETEAVGFLICQDGAILVKTKRSFPLSREIGCCIFLTREDAEKALKGGGVNG